MFIDDWKVWKRRPIVEKTWAQLKIDFSLVHGELRESQKTSRSFDFHANNAQVLQQETPEAISILANATLADRQTMAEIEATITTLTTQLSEANKVIMDNVAVIGQMRAEVATYQENVNRGNGVGR